MTRFFLDEGATSVSMYAAKSIIETPGSSRFVGLWGARVDGGQMLVPVSDNETIAVIAADPLGRDIPTYSHEETAAPATATVLLPPSPHEASDAQASKARIALDNTSAKSRALRQNTAALL